MSLVLAVLFNENGGASNVVRDYSETNKDATTVSNLTTPVDTAESGFLGEGNGASTDVQFSVGGGITYTEPFSIFWQGVIDAGAGDGYIYFRTNHSYLFYDSVAGNIEGGVWDNGAGTFETTTHSISTAIFYKVLLTYDDTNKQELYLDDSSVVDTNLTDCSPQDTAAVRLFTDGTDYMNGKTRELLIDNTRHDLEAADGLFQESQGHPLSITAHNFQLGDLITNSTEDAPQACVDLVVDANNIRVRITNGLTIIKGDQWFRVGNRFDTSRQHSVLQQANTTLPTVGVYDAVSKHADVGTEAKLVAIYDRDGFRRKGNDTFYTANVTITAQDRWNMLDPSGGGFTTTVPASPNLWEEHTFVDATDSANAGGNLLTISGNGNNIDGAANKTIQNKGAFFTIVWNGTEWRTVA